MLQILDHPNTEIMIKGPNLNYIIAREREAYTSITLLGKERTLQKLNIIMCTGNLDGPVVTS